MTLKTRRDLVDAALDILGLIAAGQEPQVEDVAKAEGYVDTTVADLTARDVYYVADVSEIELSIFHDLATCLANACMASFGMANDPRVTALSIVAESNLRIKSSQGPTYAVLKGEYF